MGIEYLSGIKPGMKIDLPGMEKKKIFHPENYRPKLEQILAEQSASINQEYGDFLENDSRIKMVGSEASADLYLVESKEALWAKDSGLDRGAFDEKKKNGADALTEMAVTAVLHKFLKENFIIASSSKFDDYENGVDNVIIDRETGAVICGFDEVLRNPNDPDTEKKDIKLEKKMLSGGASLRYGATIKEGKLERVALQHLPAFYLALTKDELSDLLVSLCGEKENDSESKIFNRFTTSLEEQIKKSQKLNLHPELKNNFLAAEGLLNQFKSAALEKAA